MTSKANSAGFGCAEQCVSAAANDICAELIAMVRKEIGAVAAFKKVATVKRLPKTRSGKILRATMRKMANGEQYTQRANMQNK